jgi:hypothetical protein
MWRCQVGLGERSDAPRGITKSFLPGRTTGEHRESPHVYAPASNGLRTLLNRLRGVSTFDVSPGKTLSLRMDRDEILRVLRAFEASGLEYVLIGSTAMGFHGLVFLTGERSSASRAF